MQNIGLNLFDAVAIIIVLVAALSYVNQRFFGLAPSIAMTILGAVGSILVVAVDRLLPASDLAPLVSGFISGIDFHETLINGMLSFLLFAGALHVDWNDMRKGRWPILLLSTVGVILSTLIVGFGFYALTSAFGIGVPLIWCFVFGALISPTDPVAVMAILKRTTVPPTLQATVAGESLFNDGVGVVVFTILLGAAIGTEEFTFAHASHAFLYEAGGGVILGLLAGWIGFLAMRSIDEFNVEVMITLAIVMGGYAVAHWLHVSGPVAMAVAGLLIGNHGVTYAMSDITRDYVLKFWTLIDELLNAILFLLIGLELIVLSPDPVLIAIGLLAIPLALFARSAAVWPPVRFLPSMRGSGTFPILVWGGLRGGISVALALSLPMGPARSAILTATYAVVLFAVIVQGGSIARLITRVIGKPGADRKLREAAGIQSSDGAG